MSKILKTMAFLILSLFIFPFNALADAPALPTPPASISGGLNFVDNNIARPGGLVRERSIITIIETFILWLLGFVGILLLVALIWGGFKYIFAFGDDKKIGEAKKVIIGSLIGVIVIATSFLIVRVVRDFISPDPTPPAMQPPAP